MKKTLVLLPGWTQNEKPYKRLINSAPDSWEVVVAAYEEIVPTGDPNAFQEGLLGFLNNKKLSKVSLVGHSLGGALGMEFVLSYPQKVNRLFLVDAAGIANHENNLQIIQSMGSNIFAQGGRKVIKQMMALPRILRNFSMHKRLGSYGHKVDLQAQITGITIPTTIIWGEKDCVTPLWNGQRLHQLIPNSKLVILKDMDHDWIFHSPEKFWENIY